MEKKQIKYTDKGYSYVECTENDCYNWGGIAICDYCNEKMNEKIYLIFVLGMAFCPKCFHEWQKDSYRYENDIKFQKENHIRWYKNHKLDVIE